MMKYIWLVYQFKGEKSGLREFETQGAFSEKTKAVAACHSHNFCIVRLTIDEELPLESLEILCWYPLSEPEPVWNG